MVTAQTDRLSCRPTAEMELSLASPALDPDSELAGRGELRLALAMLARASAKISTGYISRSAGQASLFKEPYIHTSNVVAHT